MMNQINDIGHYKSIIDRYSIKTSISNDYIQMDAEDLVIQGKLYAECGKKNVYLFVKKDGFYRAYYYINDYDEVMDLGSNEIVTEILFRGSIGEPAQQVEYLEKCGFKRNLVRDQYVAKYSSFTEPILLEGVKIEKADNIEQIKWAINLFNASFDKWSGDYIPEAMAGNLLKEQAIIMATNTIGTPLGALHLEKKQGCLYLNHIAVFSEYRRRRIGRGLLDAYIEIGHVDDNSRYAVWVQRLNRPAVKMYQDKGFAYSNKSTLSMIKY